MKKPVKNNRRFVIVTNTGYGLYCGEIEASDAEISRDKSVRVFGCRHIAHWQGRSGGITSLAAHGPCGPRVTDSRIGAPSDALITSVMNVFDCTDEARKAFSAITYK